MFGTIFTAIGGSVLASIVVLGLTIYGGYVLVRKVVEKVR